MVKKPRGDCSATPARASPADFIVGQRNSQLRPRRYDCTFTPSPRILLEAARNHRIQQLRSLNTQCAMAARSIDLLAVEANEAQHDAVLDYYGRRLATCSSDKTIKIFEVEGENHRLVETLKGYVNRFLSARDIMLTAWQTRGCCVVCSMGAPQIRQHSRFFIVRRQGHYLARAERRLAEDL